MEFVEVWGPPTGLLRVFQFVLLVLFVGAVPAALGGIVLAVWGRRRGGHWSAEWSRVFWAGFLFQAGSLVSGLFVLWLLWVDIEGADLRHELFGPYGAVVGAALLNVAFGAIGLRFWRVLRTTVSESRMQVP
jgi:hypothetical protein